MVSDNLSHVDPLTESQPEKINLDVYVPPDERLSPKKLSELIGNAVQATAHFIIPAAKSFLEKDSSFFQSFDEIKEMYSKKRSQKLDGLLTEKLHKLLPDELVKAITHASKGNHLMFPTPQVLTGDAVFCLFYIISFSCFLLLIKPFSRYVSL